MSPGWACACLAHPWGDHYLTCLGMRARIEVGDYFFNWSVGSEGGARHKHYCTAPSQRNIMGEITHKAPPEYCRLPTYYRDGVNQKVGLEARSGGFRRTHWTFLIQNYMMFCIFSICDRRSVFKKLPTLKIKPSQIKITAGLSEFYL